MDAIQLLHHATCGAVAAAGLAVRFNMRSRTLPWCAVTGALALAVRTAALNGGLRLEGASFLAAMAVECAVQLLQAKTRTAGNALAVAGCIPMVPGALAAKAILGLVAVTAASPATPSATLVTAMQDGLRVILTIGPSAPVWRYPSFCQSGGTDQETDRFPKAVRRVMPARSSKASPISDPSPKWENQGWDAPETLEESAPPDFSYV